MTEQRSIQGAAGQSDEELWRSFVGGDDAALEALMGRYTDELFWYLLLSTGDQQEAARHLLNVWEIVARHRYPWEGFGSFKVWLYAVATQNALPPTHPEPMGLSHLISDLKRRAPSSGPAEVFYRVVDMQRAMRQPFLLATVAGLSLQETAKACNFTGKRTLALLEKAYRAMSRSTSLGATEERDEL